MSQERKSRKEYQRKWRKKNKDKVLKYYRDYRKKNREKRRRWNREWIDNNRDRYNASKYIYRDKCKRDVLRHYSGGEIRCAKCGIKDIDVLCLDHINNNGAEHRRVAGIASRGSAGINTYEAIKRDGFPQGFQVLCANCNLKKEIERKRKERMKNSFYRNRVKEVVQDGVN